MGLEIISIYMDCVHEILIKIDKTISLNLKLND